MAAASPAHEDSSVLRFMRSTVPSDESGGLAPGTNPVSAQEGRTGIGRADDSAREMTSSGLTTPGTPLD
ncbi:magnesium transporter NIPA [Streptomyces laurentii]|uniref:Magnesium transporter NIPA n=1 Tax=Streptomyces laurentii TaxID=39478 RepID=A0A160P9V3_STRLU|nr:magnesium transporter NIPA [Streptomyces laurentii]